jgi:hypothetical protein
MARGKLVVFTNPVSEEREAEFNDWYNDIHAGDIVSLPGFASITRLRVGPAVRESFPHRYLALYECHDIELARASLEAARESLNISGALAEDAVAVFYEDIFSLGAEELPSRKT